MGLTRSERNGWDRGQRAVLSAAAVGTLRFRTSGPGARWVLPHGLLVFLKGEADVPESEALWFCGPQIWVKEWGRG